MLASHFMDFLLMYSLRAHASSCGCAHPVLVPHLPLWISFPCTRSAFQPPFLAQHILCSSHTCYFLFIFSSCLSLLERLYATILSLSSSLILLPLLVLYYSFSFPSSVPLPHPRHHRLLSPLQALRLVHLILLNSIVPALFYLLINHGSSSRAYLVNS